MPALGADMEAGTLVEWLVKPGDRVKSGEVVAVVETQKSAIEVEIFLEGVVSNSSFRSARAFLSGQFLRRSTAQRAPRQRPPPNLSSPRPRSDRRVRRRRQAPSSRRSAED